MALRMLYRRRVQYPSEDMCKKQGVKTGQFEQCAAKGLTERHKGHAVAVSRGKDLRGGLAKEASSAW